VSWPRRYPALELWRAELAAGQRTPTTFDALWRAACAEMWALEHADMGLQAIADGFERDAARIILDAAKRQAAGQ